MLSELGWSCLRLWLQLIVWGRGRSLATLSPQLRKFFNLILNKIFPHKRFGCGERRLSFSYRPHPSQKIKWSGRPEHPSTWSPISQCWRKYFLRSLGVMGLLLLVNYYVLLLSYSTFDLAIADLILVLLFQKFLTQSQIQDPNKSRSWSKIRTQCSCGIATCQ